MAHAQNGKVVSFKGNAALAPFRVVTRTADNECGYWATQTTQILGVTLQDSKQTGSAVPVVLDGLVKLTCLGSVTAGELVGPATDAAGKIAEVNDVLTSTAALLKVCGVAMENGSTDSVILVALQINNRIQLG
jgi:hypothetical protein